MEEYKSVFYIVANIIIKQCVQDRKWLVKYRTGKLHVPTFGAFIIRSSDIEFFYLKKKSTYENFIRSGVYLIGATRPISKLCTGAQNIPAKPMLIV
jgi:hypothetical protein